MTRLTCCLLFIIAFFISKNDLMAQDEKFKSIFIYNFTKLIEWPNSVNAPEFIITVYGNSTITNELKALAAKMKVGSSTIVVNQISSMAQFTKSNILFYCKDKTDQIPSGLDHMQKQNVLIISEKTSACSLGSAINFVSNNGNLAFEISSSRIEKSGLKVNSKLLSLGTVVNQ